MESKARLVPDRGDWRRCPGMGERRQAQAGCERAFESVVVVAFPVDGTGSYLWSEDRGQDVGWAIGRVGALVPGDEDDTVGSERG